MALPTQNTTPLPQAEASPYTRHMPALDGVRALAVLGVASHHLFVGAWGNAVTRAFHQAFIFGAAGVDLFFVLSGFLITGILFDSLGERRYFRKFYARRALRIFPLYYAALLVFAVYWHYYGAPEPRLTLSFALYLQNTHWLTGPIYTLPELPLLHFWSLAIEEQFYLVWPLLVFLIASRRKLLGVCAAALVLCPLLRLLLTTHGFTYDFMHTNTLCRADSLLAGAALALLLRGPARERVLRLAPWIALAGALGVVAINFAALLPRATHEWLSYCVQRTANYTTLAVMFTGFTALALRGGGLARLCSIAPLRWLGRYSYGIYVFHVPLFLYFRGPVRDFLFSHGIGNHGVVVVLTAGAVFALTCLCAYASYQLFERRFLRLKRYFDYRPHADTVLPS
jgi:peptidoglycan/LPS O-acetylase OafA/YrhL